MYQTSAYNKMGRGSRYLAILTIALFMSLALAAGAFAASFAYIPNSGSNNVSVINTTTNTVISTVPVGLAPVGVAVHPTGLAVYIANFSDDTVSVIDTTSNLATATVPVAGNPSGIAVSPDGLQVYVTSRGSNTVSVINTMTLLVTSTITVGSNPSSVAISPDGLTAYVCNVSGSTMSVIDTASGSVVNTIAVALGAEQVAVSPAGDMVYVVGPSASALSIIDAATLSVINLPVGNLPTGVVVNAAGSFTYTANFGNNTISIVDNSSNTVVGSYSTGQAPYGIDISSANLLYVANFTSNNVSVIDAATGTLITTVNVGTSPMPIGRFIGPDMPNTADIAVTINADTPQVLPGGNVTYSVTVYNNGPDTATAVSLSNTIPAGSSFISASAGQGTCSFTAPTITCDIGHIAFGADVSATIVLSAPSTPGNFVNTITVAGSSIDGTPANNTASASVTVPEPEYTLTVAKAGDSTGTVVSLPAGINCGATCSDLFKGSTVVTLTATPAVGSIFAGWSAPCSGADTCTITMSADTTVTATFSHVYTVKGKVTTSGGGVTVPLPGVVVTLAGNGVTATAVTSSTGNYILSDIPSGTYTVTPARSGYVFTPGSRSVTVAGANVIGQNFVAIADGSSVGHSISGKIKWYTAPLSGVLVILDGPVYAKTKTNSAGTYIFPNLPNGVYTLIAYKIGHSFKPYQRVVTVNNADVTGQKFSSIVP